MAFNEKFHFGRGKGDGWEEFDVPDRDCEQPLEGN